MYYDPQSGMYFSYDPVTQTHKYHGRATATKFSLLSHIIFNRSQQAQAANSRKPHKVTSLLLLLIESCYCC